MNKLQSIQSQNIILQSALILKTELLQMKKPIGLFNQQKIISKFAKNFSQICQNLLKYLLQLRDLPVSMEDLLRIAKMMTFQITHSMNRWSLKVIILFLKQIYSFKIHVLHYGTPYLCLFLYKKYLCEMSSIFKISGKFHKIYKHEDVNQNCIVLVMIPRSACF